MKKKTKILIIVGACILILGSGTGITIHAVKKSANATVTNSGISNSEEVSGSSESNKGSGTLTIADNKNTSDASKTDNSTDASSAKDSERSTERNTERSTEGRTTEGTTEKGRESSTEGSTEKRTTEGTTERTTEASTECTEHTHTWEAVYKTVHHEATYKEEQYVVREAWDEEIKDAFYICNQCGRAFNAKEVESGDLSSPATVEFITHISECQGVGSSYHLEYRVVDTIHHPAEYGTRQVVDKPAWDEQVLDYYKCKCGSTKK